MLITQTVTKTCIRIHDNFWRHFYCHHLTSQPHLMSSTMQFLSSAESCPLIKTLQKNWCFLWGMMPTGATKNKNDIHVLQVWVTPLQIMSISALLLSPLLNFHLIAPKVRKYILTNIRWPIHLHVDAVVS